MGHPYGTFRFGISLRRSLRRCFPSTKRSDHHTTFGRIPTWMAHSAVQLHPIYLAGTRYLTTFRIAMYCDSNAIKFVKVWYYRNFTRWQNSGKKTIWFHHHLDEPQRANMFCRVFASSFNLWRRQRCFFLFLLMAFALILTGPYIFPQLLVFSTSFDWPFHPWRTSVTQRWRAWDGLWSRTVELYPHILMPVLLKLLPTRPRLLRHPWKQWLHPMTQALRRQWTHTQLRLNLPYLSRHRIAQLSTLFVTRGSPNSLQDLYSLKQHQGVIHWRDTDLGYFQMSWSPTLFLRSLRQLGVVFANCRLLAPSFWDSSITRAQSFSQCPHWDDLVSRWNWPCHQDPGFGQTIIRYIDDCDGIWGTQRDMEDGWTHELPRCDPNPSTSFEFPFWIKWSPVCIFVFWRFTSTRASSRPHAKLFQKWNPATAGCVCLICKDVKLRFWFFTSYAGGCRECHSSAANENGYDILWYRSGTLDRRTCQFSGMGRGSTLEPPCRFVSISLQRTKLHQNPPQSKDVESTLGTICLHDRRQHRRRQLFIG